MAWRGFYLLPLLIIVWSLLRSFCRLSVNLLCYKRLRNVCNILYSIRQWVLSVLRCSCYWKCVAYNRCSYKRNYLGIWFRIVANFRFWGSGFGSLRFGSRRFPVSGSVHSSRLAFLSVHLYCSRLLFSLRQKVSPRRPHNTLTSETRVSGGTQVDCHSFSLSQ